MQRFFSHSQFNLYFCPFLSRTRAVPRGVQLKGPPRSELLRFNSQIKMTNKKWKTLRHFVFGLWYFWFGQFASYPGLFARLNEKTMHVRMHRICRRKNPFNCRKSGLYGTCEQIREQIQDNRKFVTYPFRQNCSEKADTDRAILFHNESISIRIYLLFWGAFLFHSFIARTIKL